MISPDCVNRNQNDIGFCSTSVRSRSEQRMRQQERQTGQEMGNSSQWYWENVFALLRLRCLRFAQLVLGLVVLAGRGQRLGQRHMAARIIRIKFDCTAQFG